MKLSDTRLTRQTLRLQTLDTFLTGKKFNTQEAVKNAYEDFIASRSTNFFKKSIDKLPLHWKRCIYCSGKL
jgi:hypothetical protein